MEYLIGVDIGTSGTKAIAFSIQGRVLSSAYASYPVMVPVPGTHELDPEQLLHAVTDCIHRVMQDMPSSMPLKAVSLSSAMHGLMVVDRLATPLTRLITWADSRSEQYAAGLRTSDKAMLIYRHTGTPIHPMSPLCKIMWLRNESPELFSRAYKFISIKEYLWHRLFGTFCIDYSVASATGLFDIYSLQWFQASLETAGITDQHLSTPVPPGYMALYSGKASSLPLRLAEGTPFVIGANDGCLANLGTAAIAAQDMTITIGTSGAVRMASRQPVEDPEARIFNYILSENLYISGGAINNGTVAVKWFTDQFMPKRDGPSTDFLSCINEVTDIPPGCDGLLFLPYLLGERAPVWDARARAVFFGIHPAHGPLHFLRAVLEGICFSLYQVARILGQAVGTPERIYVSGGFIHAPLWPQMLADIFDRELCVTNDADASAIGAAILGMYALGLIENLEASKKIIAVQKVYSPNHDNHRAYRKNFSVFDVLYGKLKSEFERISQP